MSLRMWAIAGTALTIVGLGTALVHAIETRAASEARAEIYRARTDSLMEVVRADSIRQAREDSTAARRIERADSARALAETRAARAARAADRAREDRDSLEAAVMQATDSTSTREALEDLRASHETQVRALESQVVSLEDALAAVEASNAAKDDQILARDRTVTGLREALAAANAAAGIDTSRGWVETWGERLAWTAGGAGIGYLAAGGL